MRLKYSNLGDTLVGTISFYIGGDEVQAACTDLSDKEKFEILKEIHDSPIGGHSGINRRYRKLKQFINWQCMKDDVEKYISVKNVIT